MSPKISIIKRDTLSIKVTIVDECNNAVDITGYTLYFTVKSQANITSGDNTATIKKIITSHTDPEAGISHIPLTSSDTNQTAGDYFYDVQVKTPDGSISSCVQGQFEIIQDITASV